MIKIDPFSIFHHDDDDEIPDIDAESTIDETKGRRQSKVKFPDINPPKMPHIGKALKDITDPYSDFRLGMKSVQVNAGRKVKGAALKAKIGAEGIKDRFRKDGKVKAKRRGKK